MIRTLETVVILVTITAVLPATFHIPCVRAQDADVVRIEERFFLAEQEHAAYNLTCFGERGYYGSAVCYQGEVVLSIVDTVHLAEFLGGEFSPDSEWRDQSVAWEYPCPETRNTTFVVQLESGGSTEVSLLVVEDRTPVTVALVATRVALYLPKYSLDFTFYGNFLDSAYAKILDTTWDTWLDGNESMIWNAFALDRDLSVRVPLPDGEFGVSVVVTEQSGRVTNYVLTIVKRSGEESVFMVSLVLAGVLSSLVIETFRKRCQRSKVRQDILILGD